MEKSSLNIQLKLSLVLYKERNVIWVWNIMQRESNCTLSKADFMFINISAQQVALSKYNSYLCKELYLDKGYVL